MAEVITLSDGSVLDVSRFPLPEGVEDGVVNRAQLAVAFRVSENTVTKWIGQGLPALTAGANGVSYEFQLSHCFAWRAAKDDALRAGKLRGDQLAAQAALAFRNLDEDQAEDEGQLTAKDMREWSEAEYHRNRVAEQRGELVRAGRMSELLEDLLGVVRTSINTMPDYMEREFGLSATHVDKVQTRCDQILIDMRQRIEREILGPAVVTPLSGRGEQSNLGL